MNQEIKRIHFIGLEDPGMADLAVALAKTGRTISGSAEGLSEDNRAKLLKVNLLPGKISNETTHVILGVTVAANHPELATAKDLKLPIYSLPDFISYFSRNKQRLVITGTTGKNIIALLVIHALTFHKRAFDYLISTVPTGKESSISLSDAGLIVIEGQDVSLTPGEKAPSFLKYHHHIGVISDIEWSAANGYSRDEYVSHFGKFETILPKSGILIYNEKDSTITNLLTLNQPDVLYVPYAAHPSTKEGGQEFLLTDKEHYPMRAPGPNGLLNMNAAKDTLKKVGITSGMFYQAIRSFQVTTR